MKWNIAESDAHDKRGLSNIKIVWWNQDIVFFASLIYDL